MPLPFLYILSVIIMSVFSVSQWWKLPISTPIASWVCGAYIIFFNFRLLRKELVKHNVCGTDLWLSYAYFLWLAINTIRGAVYYTEDNYWIWKNLVNSVFCLSLPCWIYILTDIVLSHRILRSWMRYGMLLFIPLMMLISRDAWHFYLSPLFFLGCFLFNLPKKWTLIIGVLLAAMCVINLGARSQVIISALTLVGGLVYKMRRIVPVFLLKIGHIACYVVAITLLYLGISGEFNVFEMASEDNQGKYQSMEVDEEGELKEEDLSDDTRTFIYMEVISSAINHDYLWQGRTPARGNDSAAFGKEFAIEQKTGLWERHSNELLHLNVFTWLGLIGVLLYSFFYIRASFLALYRSRSFALKLLGCMVAFHWLYGWVEDINRFDINNFTIWLFISVCLSKQFRRMDDKDFLIWIRSIVRNNNLTEIEGRRRTHKSNKYYIQIDEDDSQYDFIKKVLNNKNKKTYTKISCVAQVQPTNPAEEGDRKNPQTVQKDKSDE